MVQVQEIEELKIELCDFFNLEDKMLVDMQIDYGGD